MRHAIAFAVVLGLSSAAWAGEETNTVSVTIKGMSCPDGCGASVTKALQGVDGVKEVKLADFEKGLFTVVIDGSKPVKPSAIKAKIGKFEIAKVEASISGTVSVGEKDALTLLTPSGAKYTLTSCGECPSAAAAAPKTDAKPADKVACEDPLAKVRAWVKEGKTAVKLSGDVGECCEGALSLAVAKAELPAPKN
jgi:copper chaperone CopZ